MDWIDALPDLSKALQHHQKGETAGLEAHVELIKRRPEWAHYLELSQDHLLKLFTEVYAEVNNEQLEERWSQALVFRPIIREPRVPR